MMAVIYEDVPVSKLVPWDKNPRTSEPEDLERLTAQIRKLKLYKPFLCFRENGKYVVLGGNMRLQVVASLGIEIVKVAVVKPKDEAEKLAYSLSDNDRAGYYDEQALAELLWEHKDQIDKGLFKVDLGVDDGLARVLETMGRPVAQTEVYGSGDKDKGPVICPNCGAVVEEGE
jgi:ParB-like chromosome segregation protein Spo0J